MLTIRQLAKATGYSPTTISFVLNDSPAGRTIPKSTKERIKKMARELGYHPNQFARSLRSNRSQAVGIIVPDISDPYCAQILRGMNNALFASNYLAMLIDIQNSRSRFRKCVSRIFERRIEGVIAIANSLQLETDMLDIFEKKIPVILIGRERCQRWMSSVSVDNEAGTRAAMKHLYTLGHRKIAFIKGPKSVVDTERRWQGICDFAKDIPLKLDPKLVVHLKEVASSSETGFQAMNELLRRGAEFTAVVAFDDMTAFGAVRALSQAGRKVPEQCSIVGFDNVAAAAYYNPPLTTVRQPMEELGKIGARIFLNAVENSDVNGKAFEPIHQKVRPILVVRNSTAAMRS